MKYRSLGIGFCGLGSRGHGDIMATMGSSTSNQVLGPFRAQTLEILENSSLVMLWVFA